MGMRTQGREDLARRQAQWDALNQWKAAQEGRFLSLEDRASWYRTASRFARNTARSPAHQHIRTKVDDIRTVRQRLAHVRSSA